jgi:hypothetical protein
LSILLIVPAVNILSAPTPDAVRWKDKSFLYNMDFATQWLARLLYPLGVSTDPEQVIIGRDDWLYLGDGYERTLSVDRRTPTEAEIALAKRIGAATKAWERYLKNNGVQLFRIMVAPNKGSIYPEYLPLWARPVSPNVTDALLAEVGRGNYIDLRGSLIAAKADNPEALYYKTDTHWNSLGAGLAFRFFAQQVGMAIPELRWLPDEVYTVHRVDSRKGGDLAKFLRLTENLRDDKPIIHAQSLPVTTTHIDYDTGQIVYEGGNIAVGSRHKPLLVKAEGAINNKKVLWLRDSFGTAMSPLMAATFSDVLQIHWREGIKPGGRLEQLVADWKPDYVFFTVVERDSRVGLFAAYRPPVEIP